LPRPEFFRPQFEERAAVRLKVVCRALSSSIAVASEVLLPGLVLRWGRWALRRLRDAGPGCRELSVLAA